MVFSLFNMYQIEVMRKFSEEEIQILKTKYLDDILLNSKVLTKNQILDRVRNFRDLIDRFG